MNYTGSSSRPVTVDFLTTSYRICGKVMISHTGLLGVMSDTNISIIEIREAQLSRLFKPSHRLDSYQIARLVKTQVVAACANRREDLGSLAMGGYNPVCRYPIHITSADYEVDGTLEWNGRFDMHAVMSQGYRDFIPLFGATISAILFPTISVQSPAMLVNRKYIDLVALATEHCAQEEKTFK